MKQAYRKLSGVFLAAAWLAACTPAPQSVSSVPAPQIVSVVAPVSSRPASSLPPYESPVDFGELADKGGTDICAWLSVPGTNIDHPVTTGVDNAYYLTHDAYGARFAGGTPFIDMSNAADFSDPVTVMYGHVMPDDTIFSQLHRFKDPAFFAKNREVTLYLPQASLRYRIFAAFPHGTENLLYEKDYTDPASFRGLLAYIGQKEKDAPDETNAELKGIAPGDKLLLLSTCDDEGASRYLVAARLV